MEIEQLFEQMLTERKASHFKEDAAFLTYQKRLLAEAKKNLDPAARVFLARYQNRPKAQDFVHALIEEPLYFHGDRTFYDDQAFIGGIGRFAGRTVTFLATQKGKSLEESIRRNFGMVHPEGYRKGIRLMEQAEKFKRPILTFIDTPGAYPGVGAEERGQGEAIAKSIATFSSLSVPTIAVITGEGASGGALALAVADRLLMMENAIFSILSPEGFASILWKDASRAKEAMPLMKFTAEDILQTGLCDAVIEEDLALTEEDFTPNFQRLAHSLESMLDEIEKIEPEARRLARQEKFGGNLWDLLS